MKYVLIQERYIKYVLIYDRYIKYVLIYDRYMKLEVPVHIVRMDSMTEPCLEALSELPAILTHEEEDEYSKSNDDVTHDLVSRLYNSSGRDQNDRKRFEFLKLICDCNICICEWLSVGFD